MAKTKNVSKVSKVSKDTRNKVEVTTEDVTQPVTEPVEPTKKYELNISVNGTLYDVSTDSLLQALTDYAVPPVIKTEMLLTVTNGNKVRDIALKVFEARRIFGNKNALEVFADKLVNLVG